MKGRILGWLLVVSVVEVVVLVGFDRMVVGGSWSNFLSLK